MNITKEGEEMSEDISSSDRAIINSIYHNIIINKYIEIEKLAGEIHNDEKFGKLVRNFINND
ncbi:MAG: hypothetical protein V3V33_16450 [Candidatus Lokiarchaeia archaeon]